jgi:Spy/CpxP family protein refolding chaperone
MPIRILLAGLLASTLVFAQRGGGGRGGSNMSNMSSGETRMDRLTSALKLNKDQRREIKAAMDDAQKEATPVYEQLPKSHLAIAEAVAAGKSQEEIEKAVHHHAELETQIVSIELHAFAKAVVLLEPDQKQLGIPSLFAMVRGVFGGKNWNVE